ncbi:S-layer homology domain-containing protein [Paenibacillus sp. UNC451MF]|uniref:S-layer homology domain-containing protein n=1 Tax=Paenibacillus sp. UNC451MF TaxID=1449063 RepID=UPI0006904AED|nr:S-layer homology domain-containing protein [Paenibacillus sp. UNC451MF]
MKRILSTVLSLSMAFSMAPGIVGATDAPKDSSAFSDLKDLDAGSKAKFDEMLKAGIFDGVQDGVFGLKDKMTRAQFAKVASLIFQLKTDMALKTSTFTDVLADDPTNGYALPYIDAISKAGITDGYGEGLFNPGGQVTKEQLAAFLIKGLKLDAKLKETKGVQDDTVSDWAKGYVALAIENKLMSNGAGGKFEGTSPATRDLLVLSAYEARKLNTVSKIETVTKVSIEKAEVTGAKTISVTLNGALADTAKLNATVSRGATAVPATVKWNDTKHQFSLVTESAMSEGTYTVKIEAVKDGGLTVDKGKADVTVQKENITKIDFLSASDTIAQGNKVTISFKAINQYNEQSDIPASRFDIKTSPNLTVQSSVNDQTFSIRIDDSFDRNDNISFTISAPENSVHASKNYRVGDRQSVAKIELGKLILKGTKKKLEAGDSAVLEYKAYDQYGFLVTDLTTLREETITYVTGADALESGTITDNKVRVDKGFGFYDDEDNDNKPDLKINTAQIDSRSSSADQEMTLAVTANASGQTATTKIVVTPLNVPYDISFGKLSSNMIAWGDDDAYLPIEVKDKSGNILSTDDVLQFVDDIRIYSTGSARVDVDSRIATEGVFKGKVKIGGLKVADEDTRKAGTLKIEAVVGNSDQKTSFSTTVSEKRHPEQVYVSSEPKPKMLPSMTAFGISTNNMLVENKMKLKFKDQYGEDFDKDYSGYEVDLSLKSTNGTVTNAVYFSKGSFTGTPTWVLAADEASSKYTSVLTFKGDDTRAEGYSAASTTIKSIRDTDLTFTPITGDNNEATYQMTARLYKTGTNRSEVSSVTRTVDLIKAKEAEKLKYSLKSFANGLVATDELNTNNFAGNPSANLAPFTLPIVKTPENDVDVLKSYFAGKIELSATNSFNDNVAIPNNLIQQISVSGGSAVAVAKIKVDSFNFDAYGILGTKEGSADVAVTFLPSNVSGTRIATLTKIQVKKEYATTASLTAGENGKAKEVWLSLLNKLPLHSGDSAVNGATQRKKTFGDLKLKDQYGYTEYKNYGVYRSADFYGTKFTISNAKWSDPANPGVIRIDIDTQAGTGVYVYEPGPGGSRIISFTATVFSGNKSQSVDVYPDPAH